jgi:hypothetical protein
VRVLGNLTNEGFAVTLWHPVAGLNTRVLGDNLVEPFLACPLIV